MICSVADISNNGNLSLSNIRTLLDSSQPYLNDYVTSLELAAVSAVIAGVIGLLGSVALVSFLAKQGFKSAAFGDIGVLPLGKHVTPDPIEVGFRDSLVAQSCYDLPYKGVEPVLDLNGRQHDWIGPEVTERLNVSS